MKKIFFLLLLIIITAHKNYAQAYYQYSKKTNKEICNFLSGNKNDSVCGHTRDNLYANGTCINEQDNMHLPSEEYNTLCKKNMNAEWMTIGFPFGIKTTYSNAGYVDKWVLAWSEALKGISIRR